MRSRNATSGGEVGGLQTFTVCVDADPLRGCLPFLLPSWDRVRHLRAAGTEKMNAVLIPLSICLSVYRISTYHLCVTIHLLSACLSTGNIVIVRLLPSMLGFLLLNIWWY